MVKEKSKIEYFFSHLAFPLANQLYKMEIIAKRIHIPLKSLVDKFVAGLVHSATDWQSKLAGKKIKNGSSSRDIPQSTTLSENGKTKFFLHPQQIKQVIHDMLVIMTGLVSDANLIEEAKEYHEHNTMKYRCSMFFGKVNKEGKLANDYPSLYDGNNKSEMFWKGSGTRVQFSDETKQRHYMSNFFQILNPNSVGPISDTERTEPLQEEESYNFHGDGWFNNMCWNHVSMKHSESRNDALKNWALAVVWLQLELDAMQDSLLNSDDRIEFGTLIATAGMQ